MSKAPYRQHKCTITDEWTYKGMPVIYLENDFIRVGILAGRGSDIFEFKYKPASLDFMLRLDKEIRNPTTDFSQLRHTPNQMEDYYYGGWQEALPNSPTFNYRGAELGQHGEVHLIPWKYAITDYSQQKCSLKLWVRPLRVPVLIEKTITITHDSPSLHFDERLINESRTDLDIMWGHHIAYGLPFLQEGGWIETNATDFYAEPLMPDNRRFKPGETQKWPMVNGFDGQEDDASIIPPVGASPYSDLAYLSGFPDDAGYTLWNEARNLGFQVKWDSSIFSNLWYWQERYATQDAPWWGSAYAIGLELWTSKWTNDPQKAIEAGEWLKIKSNQEIMTSFSVNICDKKEH